MPMYILYMPIYPAYMAMYHLHSDFSNSLSSLHAHVCPLHSRVSFRKFTSWTLSVFFLFFEKKVSDCSICPIPTIKSPLSWLPNQLRPSIIVLIGAFSRNLVDSRVSWASIRNLSREYSGRFSAKGSKFYRLFPLKTPPLSVNRSNFRY